MAPRCQGRKAFTLKRLDTTLLYVFAGKENPFKQPHTLAIFTNFLLQKLGTLNDDGDYLTVFPAAAVSTYTTGPPGSC